MLLEPKTLFAAVGKKMIALSRCLFVAVVVIVVVVVVVPAELALASSVVSCDTESMELRFCVTAYSLDRAVIVISRRLYAMLF